jgi:myo-inositol-1(or 4)-monophosphatase
MFCPELALAQEAARRAGDVLMQFFGTDILIREKAPADLVSEADLAAEETIVSLIRSAYPEHEILAEESRADVLSGDLPEHLWIIDPLDGTTNFVHGIPHFAVSIAYYRRGEPWCGVIFNPARDDWYVAVRGEGALHNDRPIHVGSQTMLPECLIGVGFYYDRGRVMEAMLGTIHELFKTGIHGIRRFGTASLDLAHVACGQYGGYLEYQLSPWDFAAGRLLVEEAGGNVTTATGRPLSVGPSSVLASNGPLHQLLLDVIDRTVGDLFGDD